MQAIEKIQPISVNVDAGLLKLKPNEATFLKNYEIATAKNSSGNQGGNFGLGKKTQSNWPLITFDLPAGINKVVLFYEHKELNEAYIGHWNSNGQHSLTILYGDTLTAETVYRGPALEFTLDPRNFIAEHRVYVRIIYDTKDTEQRNIREKIFICTDGQRWQIWINVLSSIATKSYNATLFPYYALFGPHFDANELIDYPVRPPMFCPLPVPIARTPADLSLQNHVLNKSIQLAYRYLLTDGRGTTLSPYSNPVFIKKSPCSSSKSLTRAFDVELDAGSAHVEHIQLLVRSCSGDWMLYDTIDKFTSDGDNAPALIGDQYWLRTNPWAAFNYDPATNKLHYTYAGDRQLLPFNIEDALDFQNDVPITSYALTPAGDALLWCNNLWNYNNLPTETLNKFKLSVGPSTAAGSAACSVRYAKITLYAIIARDSYLPQVVYTQGTAPGSQTLFGGIQRTSIYGKPPYTVQWNIAESLKFGLNFGDNNNFICYLAGTPYAAIGVQYRVDGNGFMTEIDVLDQTNSEHLIMVQNTLAEGGFFVQKFVFNVPQGKYLARIARHNASLNSDYSATSTYVQGIISHRGLQDPSRNFFTDPVRNFTKEFRIDTTNGDVDFWNAKEDLFYIYSPAQFDYNFKFVEGNVQEDSITKLPVEMVHYRPELGVNFRTGLVTDHNGFFFAYAAKGSVRKMDVRFDGNFKCAFNNFMFKTNTYKENSSGDYFAAEVLTIKDHYDADTAINNRIIVTGKVVNCDTGLGIPSIGVTMSDGPTFYTDSDGVFTLYARGYFSGIRNSQIYFNTGGECLFAACDCSPIDTVPFTTAGLACDPYAPRKVAADIVVKVKVLEQSGRGLKGGGRYPIGANFMDGAGRTLFTQDLGYVDIPTFMETGVFAPSQVSWKLSGKLNLPSFVKYFTLSRGANVSASKSLQWVGDKIDFIDNKGNIVADGNGAIRAKVTIASLINFNIENNFNTNVNYQFVPLDILRIMDDGNGNLFKPMNSEGFLDYQILGTDYNQTIQADISNQATVSNATATAPDGAVTKTVTTTTTNPVNANPDGVSFIIEYDERLLALKKSTGFWIEIIRPRDVQAIEQYCEIVNTIPVINGEPTITSGVLDTFDTYYQTRSIRIPNALGKSMSHPFESGSVTDYSTADCGSCGRNNVKDPLVKQTWYQNEGLITDDIVNNGRINGLGRCRDKNRKNFKGQAFGGIVAVHAERNRIIFVCELDWFLCDFDVNYVRATADGRVIANTLENRLSDPYPKEGSVYGCAYEDTATIIFEDGTSIWADRHNSAVIAMDYHHYQMGMTAAARSAVNIAQADAQSYFFNKFNYVLKYNASLAPEDYLANLIEIIAGIDPQTGKYNLTFRPRNGLKTDPQYFVNDEREIFYDMAETFIYNPDFKKWVNFPGYAPEFYGRLSKSISGNEMITFAAGQPWFHNTIGKQGSMNFYGVQTSQVIEVAMNFDEEKIKIFQNVIVASPNLLYFVDRVLTEDHRFFSYIPKSHFKRKEQVWYAPFLCNMGTYPNPLKPVVSLLMDGKRTFGKVALVRLVSDPEKSADYAELNSISYRITGSELSAK